MIFLLVLNSAWIIIRVFVRNLSNAFGNDVLLFEYIHEYRYVIQSVIDFINGLSILYVLYNVIKTAQIRRLESRIDNNSNKLSDLIGEDRLNLDDDYYEGGGTQGL